MITKKRIKTVLILAVLLGVFGAFSGSLQGAVIVDEPFAGYDPNDPQMNGQAVLGTGLTGTWTGADSWFNAAGITYGAIGTGGSVTFNPVWTDGWCQADVDPTATSGKLDDGDTFWFRAIVNNPGTCNVNAIRFVFGDLLGDGVGFLNDRPGGSDTHQRFRAVIWDGGSENYGIGGATIPAGTRLAVGRVELGAGATDKLVLYVPDEDLVCSAPIGMVIGDLTNSDLDAIAFYITNGNTLHADEVAIGETAEDIGCTHVVIDPNVVSIEADTAGPAITDKQVTYTVTFDKYIDDSTVDASDFSNAGTASITIDEVTCSEFTATVKVTPTSGGTTLNPETLQLQVHSGAVITDLIEGRDVTVLPVAAETTLEVLLDNVAEAGDDIYTWPGHGHKLSGSGVNNDPNVTGNPLDYHWTAEEAGTPPYPEVIFSDADDPNSTVTTTKELVYFGHLDNYLFEADLLADGDYTNSPTAWTEGYYEGTSTVWVAESWGSGVTNPDPNYCYEGVAAEGRNIAYVAGYPGYDEGLNQTLSVRLTADTQYDLSVMVGNPYIYNGTDTTNDYRIELISGQKVVASDTGPSPVHPVDPNWIEASLTHHSGPSKASDPNLGKFMRIRLISVDNGTNGWELNFDDVNLEIDGERYTGIDRSPRAITLTLAVNNEDSSLPDVTDTAMLYVYDLQCLAEQAAGGGVGYPPTDFDEDCDTDFDDVIIFAAAWLDDYTLTEPIPK